MEYKHSEEKRQKDRNYWHQTRERRLELQKARYQNNPEQFADYNRRARLKKNYGISVEFFNQLREDQEYSCAICGTHEDDLPTLLNIDHCHLSGQVRELLCGSCNRALGLFKDDPKILDRASDYLRAHGGEDRI